MNDVSPTPRLELRGIAKRFGSVQALRGADFTLMPGEVHALLGENGAGKTTLMHVADGLVRPDAGQVLVDGRAVAVRSPRAARRLGIGMVHQHFTAIPALTVAENVALAAGWRPEPAALRERTRALVERLGLSLDPDTIAGRLSVSLKQRLEIVKALAADVRVLLLDEPTAVLAPAEAEELLRGVRAFAARGGSVVLITHKLREALDAADRITVLRRGTVTLTGRAAGRDQHDVAEAMIGAGRPQAGAAPPPPPADAPVLVRCQALDVPRAGGWGVAVRQATLEVRAGEIIAVAAVEGNGQRELLRAIAGEIRPLRGTLDVTGPVAFIPEDRTTEGLVPELSLAENLTLGLDRPRPGGGTAPWVHGVRIDWRAARGRAEELIARFAIRAPDSDTPAGALSGGNQQKLVVARALEAGPRVLVAENPTRGLDVGAAAEVHRRLREAAAAGAAVVVHSSDLDEVLALGTRVVVMAEGAVAAAPPGAGRAEVGALMLRVGA